MMKNQIHTVTDAEKDNFYFSRAHPMKISAHIPILMSR